MRCFYLFLLCCTCSASAWGQLLGIRFNRLVGRDADQLPTTNCRLGGVDLPILGIGFGETFRLKADENGKVPYTYNYLTFQARLNWYHIRFQENRLFIREEEGQNVYGLRDRDDRHYIKSNIIPWYLGASLGFGRNWGLFFADFRLSVASNMGGVGSHRRRYMDAQGNTHLEYSNMMDGASVNLNTLQVTLGGRVGLGILFLFADYAPTPFFDKEEPLRVNLLSFGLGIDLTRLPLYFKLRGKEKGTKLSKIMTPTFYATHEGSSSSSEEEEEEEEEDSNNSDSHSTPSSPGKKDWNKGGGKP